MPSLALFDFDRTIIDDDTDASIIRLRSTTPIYDRKGIIQWTFYMLQTFDYLHGEGVTKSEILAQIAKIPMMPGMDTLFEYLNTNGWHIGIISDSNSIFINHWLTESGFKDKVKDIVTNPAKFLDDGKLVVQPYENQSRCTLCPPNLCKGTILNKLAYSSPESYGTVIYVGDGRYDVCPMMCLRKNDIAFPRLGYPCSKAIEKHFQDGNKEIFPNRVKHWSTFHDILSAVQIILTGEHIVRDGDVDE